MTTQEINGLRLLSKRLRANSPTLASPGFADLVDKAVGELERKAA